MSLTEKIYNPSQLRQFLENGETDQVFGGLLSITFNRTSLMQCTNHKLNAGVPNLLFYLYGCVISF